MKIAQIASAFLESTFPYSKLIKEKTDYKFILLISNENLQLFNFDIKSNYKGEIGKLNLFQKSQILPTEVKKYFDQKVDFIEIFLFDKKSKKHVINDLHYYLLQEKFNIINFIGINRNFWKLTRLNKKSKIFYTLHESRSSRGMAKRGIFDFNFFLKKIFYSHIENKIFKNTSMRYFVFSNNEYEKMINIENIPKDRCVKIALPLFDVFKEYQYIDNDMNLPNDKYFLFYGLIKKYKGVEIFIKIASHFENQGYNFVIAGRDVDNILNNEVILPRNLIVINKHLSDSESAYIISKSYALILPYISSSQSGIPSLSFAFNKPIIASNLNGLRENLKNGYNSILCQVANLSEFFEGVEYINVEENYEVFVKNIKQNPFPFQQSNAEIVNVILKSYRAC